MKYWSVSILLFLLTLPALHAQPILGKWYNETYQQEVHFQEEGLLALVAGEEAVYGCFQLNDDLLAIAFFDDNQTKASYIFSFDSARELVLQKTDTGENFYFTYTGAAEIPAELITQFRESVAGTDWQRPVQASEPTVAQSDVPARTEVGTPVEVATPATSGQHGADLPGKLPTGNTHGRTGIVGQWQTGSEGADQEILTLTADGYFVFTNIPFMPDVLPTTHGYGQYDYKDGQLQLHFFNYFGIYDKETVLSIAQLTPESFDRAYDFYGETQYIHYVYRGLPELSTDHRTTLLAYLTYQRLTGQWKSADGMLKFLEDGAMFLEFNDGRDVLSEHSVDYDGKTFKLEHLNGEKEDYYYSGQILTFTKDQLVLQSDETGQIETYVYDGPTQLNRQQTTVYSALRQANHQGAMMTIDAMDGVRDWIWVDRKY